MKSRSKAATAPAGDTSAAAAPDAAAAPGAGADYSQRSDAARSSLLLCALSAVASMLASSCCVVQLVLNALSVGCAGFAVLTPYRLPFTGVALGLLIASSRKSVWTPATTAMAGLSVALMASPDLVDSYNNGRLSDWTAPLFGSAVVDRPRQGCVPVVTQTLTFEIKGLRCMGCASRVKSVLEALPTVTDARVYFDAGAAVISRTVPAYLVSDKASVSPEVSADTAVFAKAVRESLARIDFQYRAKLVATEHTKPECA